MAVRPEIFEFASKSLKTCLGSISPNTSGGSHGSGRSKVPLYLIDLWDPWVDTGDPDPRQRLVRVVHRKMIPNLGAVEWATLSYARGYTAPRCGAMDGVYLLDEIFDTTILRTLVPAHAFYNAIGIVDHLEIRYLWVDVLCSYWDPHDIKGWPKSYANTFQGAKINIALPDHDFWVVEQLTKELEEPSKMGEDEFYLTPEGNNPEPKIDNLDATLFLRPFFTDSWACLDRLLSPRKLFCLPDGEAIWAYEHHCIHSRYGHLHVDPRSCLLVLPEHRSRPQLLQSSASPLASSSLSPASRSQKEPSDTLCRVIKRTQQGLEGSTKGGSRIQKSVAGSKHRTDKTLRKQVAERALAKTTAEGDIWAPFPQEYASDPCPKVGEGVIPESPPFVMVVETLHRCLSLLDEEDKFGIHQILIQAYGFEKSVPNYSEWISNIGHLPEDLIWMVDGWKSMLSLAYDRNCALSISWLHWVGQIVFLSCFRWSNRPSATSNNNPTDTNSKAKIGPHPSYASYVGRQPKGFDINCARFNEPSIQWTDLRKPYADHVFAKLREASISGRPTFLGAGITADEPWSYDPPQLQYSKPCYIFDHGGKLMGRGVVDDPEWYESELAKTTESMQRGDGNCRIFALAFIMRESLELRAADLASCFPLPWDIETISSAPAAHAEQSGCNCREDVVALEVNYGLILLTSGRDINGEGEEYKGYQFDNQRYERVGIFEVYGTESSRGSQRQIYVC